MENQHSEPKHSKLGIASFVLAIILGIFIVLTFIVAGFLATQPTENEEMRDTLVGAALIIFLAAEVLPIGLGIASLFQPKTRPLFAILGLTFSVLTLFGSAGLMLLGAAVGD